MNTNDWLAKLPSPLASTKPGEPRQWYRIQASAGEGDGGEVTVADEVDVYVYGVIGGWWSGVDAKTFVRAIGGIDAKQLNIHINSVGGSVFDGLAIFQALRNHSARIVTYVDALAASAASIIAMAGDRRIVAPYASVMVHRAWTITIGNDIELRKDADELGRLTKNMARIYTNRGTSEATVDEWLDLMTEESWYYGEEAVDAGLMHEVQEDAEKTGDSSDANRSVVPGTEGEDDEDDDVAQMNRYAMAFFGFTGRDRTVAPRMPHAAAQPAGPTAEVDEQVAPETSGAEPEPTTEPEEDEVSTDLSDISSRLGLTDDADVTAIAAAIDDLKVKADTIPQADPNAQAEAEAQAALNADLNAKVDMLTEQVQNMGSQLAAANAEKATATRTAVLDAAQAAGKYTPADRATWEARYDRSPDVTTDVLASIPDYSAVPFVAAGTTGPAEPDLRNDADWDAAMARLDGPISTKGN